MLLRILEEQMRLRISRKPMLLRILEEQLCYLEYGNTYVT